MGYGYELSCYDCGYKKTIMLGVGMRYGELTSDLVDEYIQGKYMKAEIMFRLQYKQPELFEHRLMKCSKCNNIGERLYVRFDDYKTIYKCHLCKIRMKRIRENEIDALNCPKCESKNFGNTEIIGPWGWLGF